MGTEPAMEILDSHLHLWRLPRSAEDNPYSWITEDLGALYQDFTPQHAAAELTAAGVTGAVLVQADDTAADTDAMLDVCARHDWALGVVGWVDLADPTRAAEQTERFAQDPYARGVRQLIHTDPDPGVLDRADTRTTLAGLARHGLSFDVPDAFPRHLGQVADLAAALPELRIVVDHLGKPPLRLPTDSAEYRHWAEQLGALGQYSNVTAKVSGLRIPGARYERSVLAPAFELALQTFGADRLMYGGDWPMTVPAGGYRPTLSVLHELIGTLSQTEQSDIWAGTARRVYRLP